MLADNLLINELESGSRSSFGYSMSFGPFHQVIYGNDDIPPSSCKFRQILSGREKLGWQKAIKAEWNIYNTSIERWVCGCSYFLTNRFMICKHLENFMAQLMHRTLNQLSVILHILF